MFSSQLLGYKLFAFDIRQTSKHVLELRRSVMARAESLGRFDSLLSYAVDGAIDRVLTFDAP